MLHSYFHALKLPSSLSLHMLDELAYHLRCVAMNDLKVHFCKIALVRVLFCLEEVLYRLEEGLWKLSCLDEFPFELQEELIFFYFLFSFCPKGISYLHGERVIKVRHVLLFAHAFNLRKEPLDALKV